MEITPFNAEYAEIASLGFFSLCGPDPFNVVFLAGPSAGPRRLHHRFRSRATRITGKTELSGPGLPGALGG
jgi:hypothetical protein